jgi:thermolysin
VLLGATTLIAVIFLLSFFFLLSLFLLLWLLPSPVPSATISQPMTRFRAALCVLALVAAADLRVVARQTPIAGRQIRATAVSIDARTATPAALAELRGWNDNVTAWLRDGELTRLSETVDPAVPGRLVERFAQTHRGLRVVGGDVVRELNAFGQAEAIFGVFYPDVDVDVTRAITPAAAADALRFAGKGVLFPDDPVDLEILPTPTGYRLAWTGRVFPRLSADVFRVFVDAATGAPLFIYEDAQTQSPLPANAFVGVGTGVAGDQLKLSVQRNSSNAFVAVDMLRPGRNTTFDLKGDPVRATSILSGGITGGPADTASSNDDLWSDSVVTSAHAYAGFTYDFYFNRFGRHGLNDRDIRFSLIVNPARPQNFSTQGSQFSLFFNNAAYYGNGFIGFGAGSISASGVLNFHSFAAAIDIVAHELTHGVTDFTSDLVYLNESGALNEAFSDIMGAAVEFRVQPLGSGPAKADWLQGEDCTRFGTGIRSFSNPSSFGHPDHYSLKVTTTADNGGVHTNSGIMNHVYFLTVQGGTNRVSGISVTGLGIANHDKAESVIYRAVTQLLPSNATYAIARAATIQAARDLFGAGSDVEQTFIRAWDAVGVS